MKTNKRKKLTLDQVETQMEVLTKEEMNALKGGGDGTYSNPYTLNEYNLLCDYGIFSGGYVESCGYINALSPVVVTAPKKKDPFTNQDSYDLTWGSEYETLMSQIFSSGGGGGNNINNSLEYPNNQYGYNGVMDYGSGHFNGVINIARKEHWITQLPSKCYDACVTILKNYGVEAMGRDYRFIIADQNG